MKRLLPLLLLLSAGSASAQVYSIYCDAATQTACNTSTPYNGSYGDAWWLAFGKDNANTQYFCGLLGICTSDTGGIVVSGATGGAKGAGTINAAGLYINGVAVGTGGSGTVTSFAFTNGNGFTGTVTNSTTTPALSLAPSFTGVAYSNGTGFAAATAANIPAAGSANYVQFNSSGGLGGSTYLTWNGGSNVFNVGATSTPGTVSIGSLDSMVVNGSPIPIPGFALNSNIQGVIENHSYTTGTSAGAARIYLARSDGSASSPTIVVNGDHLGTLYGIGFNGVTNNYLAGGYMQFIVDGTPSSTAMPSDWILALAGASGAPAQVMRVYSNGGAVLGAPTGGNQGAGTLNAAGLYVNGAAALTANQTITLSGDASGSGTTSIPVTVSKVNGATPTASAAIAATNSSSQIIAATTTGTGTTAVLSTSPSLTTPLVAGYATASLPTCNSASKGALAYTTDGTPAFTFCNGTSWVSAGGTTFTVAGTGCTPTAATGSATAGTFTLAAGPCTAVTITFNGAVGMTAPNGWHCDVGDRTLQAAGTWFGEWPENSSTTTTATIAIPSAAGATDVISFHCTEF